MIRWGRAKRDKWERRSRQDQVEVSTRWMLFGSPWIFYAAGIPQLSMSVTRDPLSVGLTVAVFVLGLVQCALSVGGLRQGMDYYLREGPPPVARLRVMVGVTALSVVALLVLVAAGLIREVTVPAMVLFATFPGVTNVYGLMARPRRATWVLTCCVVGITVLFAAFGMEWPDVLGTLIVGLVLSYIGVFTPRSSGWYLIVMRELETAKQTQARLAVAEERLRFSRDLHDVVGRNLSVIALKSELAAQLARRGAEGSEAAVAQMTEVQRIARESQTEVRDVVRAYREADLHTELAGARGVLRAAGVHCRIEESGGELPDTVQAALGWVVREGATNVLRHAEASRCLIRVGAEDGGRTAVLLMENDGVSAPPSECGSGLAGLRERLAAVGGTLSGERESGGRVFRLRAAVPLPGSDTDTDTGSGSDTADGGAGATGETGRDGSAAEADGGGTGKNGERATTRGRRSAGPGEPREQPVGGSSPGADPRPAR